MNFSLQNITADTQKDRKHVALFLPLLLLFLLAVTLPKSAKSQTFIPLISFSVESCTLDKALEKLFADYELNVAFSKAELSKIHIEKYSCSYKSVEDVLKDLQTEHYDLMLDLTTHTSLPLRYIAMLVQADFKAGLNLGEGVHDMLISLPDLTPEQGEEVQVEATWLYEQIMQYLTTIKSND